MKGFLGKLLLLSLLFGVLPVRALGAAPEVEGKSAILMEVATGTVLAEQNAHQPLPPASVTKVMTLLLIMEAIDSGRLDWEDPVTASETAAAKGGSQIYLKQGEVLSVGEMVKAIAVSSANDCACAMAEHLAGSEEAFVELMNQRAKALGMEDTCFVNCTGLDDSPEARDHRTSAYDIALMSVELLKNHPGIKEYTGIWMDTVRQGAFGLSNTNKLIRFYNGATGLKTGFTAAAGYCLSASAQREGMELVAVVLGCESSAKRFDACRSLLDFGFARYALAEPELPEQLEVPVVLGTQSTVRGVIGQSRTLLIDKGIKAQLTTQTELDPQVTAPVSQGQRLGTVTVRAGEQILVQLPVVAEVSVRRLSWGAIFGRLIDHLCFVRS